MEKVKEKGGLPALPISREFLAQYAAPVAKPQAQVFLPYIYIAANNMADQEAGAVYVVADNTRKISAPWQITRLATRPAARHLVAKKYQDRCYEGGQSDEAFQEAIEEAESNKTWFRGEIHLVFVHAQEFSGFATLEAFDTRKSYWGVLMHQKEILDDQGRVIGTTPAPADGMVGLQAEILIENHSENSTTAKKSGNEYLSSYKFKQWQSMALTDVMKSLMAEAIKRQGEEAIKRFFEQ